MENSSLLLSLTFNSKVRILSSWLQRQFFDLLDNGEARTGCQVVFEGFNVLSRTFYQGFYAAVVQVPDVANNLVAGGRALRKEPITNPLHFATDQKLSRDSS